MVWLPCNQDAGLGARGQRGQGVVNRPQKQRPVTWRRKGPMLEWGVGPGRKPRRAGTSEAEGTNSEPPAAQGREASLQPSHLGSLQARRRSRRQKDDRNHASRGSSRNGAESRAPGSGHGPTGWLGCPE